MINLRCLWLCSFILIFNLGTITPLEAKSLGVTWYTESGMVNAVVEGFSAEIKVLAPNLEIEYQRAITSEEEFGTIVERFNKEKDGMLVLRSHGAQWLKKHPSSIPAFIGASNNPEQLGVVMNMNAPEGNITGATYYLPKDTQMKVFKAMIPNMNSLLLLVENGHPSSPLDQKETKEVCAKLGITYHDAVCANVDDIVDAVKNYRGKISVIMIGSQALIMDNTRNILKAAGKTPVVAFSSEPVKDGALGGFVADNTKLGQMLAQSVTDILINGKSVKEVPIKTDPEPKFYINGQTLVDLGITIPSNILTSATIINP